MKTFGEVKAEVLRYGFNDGPQVNAARIEDWINEAQLQIARQVEAPEFQESKELQLVSGKSKYDISTYSLLRIQDIYYPEMLQRLRPLDLQSFDGYGGTESPPDRYTLWKNELWLYPIPNVTDKLEVRYIKRPARMTAESDVPTLSEDYLHLLVDYALTRAFKAEDDAEMAQQHQAQFDRDLARYGVDVQDRVADRPKQLDGTWGSMW